MDEHFHAPSGPGRARWWSLRFSLYACTHVAEETNFDLGRCPAIRAWLARVAAQPGHVTIDA